jgi:four helix bundle protein
MDEKPTVRSFRDLRVWQAAIDLVEQVYLLTQTFPKHELYGLAGQMQRAAVSVPSNIAEGHTRSYNKEYLHHLSIARASLAELQTQLEITLRLKYCTPEKNKPDYRSSRFTRKADVRPLECSHEKYQPLTPNSQSLVSETDVARSFPCR